MSVPEVTGYGETPNGLKIRIHDFDITWAGPGPAWYEGYCFGSDDGRIILVKYEGTSSFDATPVAESGEAVNGVAFSGNVMAVSTRSEIVFIDFGPVDSDKERATYDGGAHGVITSPGGRFIAPLGMDGLFIKEPRDSGGLSNPRVRPKGSTLNFYKAASLVSFSDSELIACALRRDGFAALNVPIGGTGGGDIRTFGGTGIDVIDVCAVNSRRHPRAIASLGIDRSVHFMRDISDGNERCLSYRFDSLDGTAYKILRAGDHIGILTNKGLHIIDRLAAKLLDGEKRLGPTKIITFHMQADDACAVGGSILAVMHGYASLISIDNSSDPDEYIRSIEPSGETLEEPYQEYPTWESEYSSSLDYVPV